MRLTTFFVALLLCVYSFKVDASGGKATWLRQAMRATVAKVEGVPSMVKAAMGITVVGIALCTGIGCDIAPNYSNLINAAMYEDVAVYGVSSAEADYYANDNVDKSPADYHDKLVVFNQDGVLELGIARNTGRNNEVIVTSLEGRDGSIEEAVLKATGEKDGRRTIIKTWQIKGVWLNDSDYVNDIITVEARYAKRRETTNFKEEQAARELLKQKNVQVFGTVAGEFSDEWLLFTAALGTGFKMDEDIWLDLGIRALISPDLQIHLLTKKDRLISHVERDANGEVID